MARTGVELGPIPTWVEEFDEAIGLPLSRPIDNRRDVFEAYTAIKVIEERGLAGLPALEQAFRPIDPLTSDTILAVAKDEERHLYYCDSMINAYAPSEEDKRATLERFREIEQNGFVRHGVASLRFMIETGILQLDSQA
jgi:hypothetical protein